MTRPSSAPRTPISRTTPTAVGPTADDVIYLLRSANALFPDARLAPHDVIAAWAGLRPLLKDGAEGATAAVPREHRICESASGLLTIAGGKLTTYRAMAAELVDVVATKLRADRRPAGPAATRPPASSRCREARWRTWTSWYASWSRTRVPTAVARRLVDRYGAEATAVANLAARDSTLGGADWLRASRCSRAEVVHQARREMAMTVATS